MKNSLKEKLASYGALSAAFLMAGSHEAEAQIIYVDVVPDFVAEVNVSVDSSDFQSTGSYYNDGERSNLYVRLDPLNASNPITTYGISSSGNFRMPASASPVVFDMWAGVVGDYYNSSSMGMASMYRNGLPGGRLDVSSFGGAIDVENSSGFIGETDTPNSYYSSSSSEFLPKDMAIGETIDFNTGSVATDTSLIGIGYSNRRIRRTTNAAPPSSFNSWSGGNFRNGRPTEGDTTYLGVQFTIDGEQKNGWVRVIVEAGTSPITPDLRNGINSRDVRSAFSRLTILDYAYESQSLVPITAGATARAAIPTMGQWGLIVLNMFLLIFGVVAVKNRNKILIKKRT